MLLKICSGVRCGAGNGGGGAGGGANGGSDDGGCDDCRCLGGVRSSCVVGVWLSSRGGFAGVMALRPLLRGGVALAVVLPACGRSRVVHLLRCRPEGLRSL